MWSPLQSALCACLSIQTALIRVTNYLHMTGANGQFSGLILFDLSASVTVHLVALSSHGLSGSLGSFYLTAHSFLVPRCSFLSLFSLHSYVGMTQHVLNLPLPLLTCTLTVTYVLFILPGCLPCLQVIIVQSS